MSSGAAAGAVTGLRADGLAVLDRFQSPAQVRDLARCLEERRARGEFSPARIGAPSSLRLRTEIRGDSICWIVPPLLVPERRLLDELEQLRLALNREAFLGLFDLEIHYACYPPGSAYARHVDQPAGRGRRQVSVVLYLNDDWSTEAGGELSIVDSAGRRRDIEPIAGRLVCFLCAGREHEVRATRRERLSIAGWFSIRADGSAP